MSLESYYRKELERERDKVEKLRDAVTNYLLSSDPSTSDILRQVLTDTEEN